MTVHRLDVELGRLDSVWLPPMMVDDGACLLSQRGVLGGAPVGIIFVLLSVISRYSTFLGCSKGLPLTIASIWVAIGTLSSPSSWSPEREATLSVVRVTKASKFGPVASRA